jgi:histidinol phosphatase-like PHP family hydrolase
MAAGLAHELNNPATAARHAAAVLLLINSDAHAVAELTAGFTEATTLARTCGFTHTVRFAQHERTLVLLP